MPDFDFSTLNFAKLAVLLISVSLHESAHAYVAHWLGDGTPDRLRRKTLNPLRHLDPLMSVIVPAILIFGGFPYIFGAGRPVPVVPQNMRRPSRDFALVALAGPFTNILLTLLFTALFVGLHQANLTRTISDTGDVFRFAIMVNILLACFNLIPIPPLDGSRLVAYLLPNQLKGAFYRLDVIGFVILIVLFITKVLNQILSVTFVPAYRWWRDIYNGWLF